MDNFMYNQKALLPWEGIPEFGSYTDPDNHSIHMGVSMVCSGKMKHFLIPLLLNGQQYFVAVLQSGRDVNIVQCGIECTGRRLFNRVLQVGVPEYMKKKSPHLTFQSLQLSVQDVESLFWGVLQKCWIAAYDAVSLNHPEYVATGMVFAYEPRHYGWLLPPPLPGGAVQHGVQSNERIEIFLRWACSDPADRSVLIPTTEGRHTYMAIIQKGIVFNLVDVKFTPYAVLSYTERNVFHTQGGIQIRSVRLNEAEKHALIQEPMSRYFQTKKSDYTSRYYHPPRMIVFAMSLVTRLNDDSRTTQWVQTYWGRIWSL
jgi:hypothetical protein